MIFRDQACVGLLVQFLFIGAPSLDHPVTAFHIVGLLASAYFSDSVLGLGEYLLIGLEGKACARPIIG